MAFFPFEIFSRGTKVSDTVGGKINVLLGAYFVSEERFEMERFCLCFLPVPKIEHLGIFYFFFHS